jgi:hypothetical protein
MQISNSFEGLQKKGSLGEFRAPREHAGIRPRWAHGFAWVASILGEDRAFPKAKARQTPAARRVVAKDKHEHH